MANNFLKWWKTKIVNGYRQFSGSNGYSSSRMSDTERLLDSDTGLGTNDFSRNDCSTPPNPTNYTELNYLPNNEQDKINVEKFSYVSMESGYDQSGQERQEFSFTLYDFDGYGKITKDDIAGLVTTIYETLKSYVQVPYYGSKTIKVQLIITPNQKKQKPQSETNNTLDKKCTEELPKNNINNRQQVKQNNVNVNRNSERSSTSREICRHHERKQKQESFCCSFVCAEKQNTYNICDENVDCVSSNYCNRVGFNETNDNYDECYGEKNKFKQQTCSHKHIPKYSTAPTQKYNIKNSQSRRVSLCPVFCTKTWRTKNRSSSLQRQELLEIIQANMDKNSYRFQTTRRKQIPTNLTYLTQMSVSDYEQQPEEKLSPQSTLKLNDIANMMSSPNYLVNLSNLNSSNLMSNKVNRTKRLKLPYSQYDKLLNAVVSMSNKNINTNPFHKPLLLHQNCKCGRHYRVKSNETNMQNPIQNNLTGTKRVTNRKSAYCANDFKRTKSIERVHSRSKLYESKFEQTPALRKHSKKFSRLILSHSNSLHYLKHQNRQEDHARAMAQVVRWLEKEVSANDVIKTKLEKKLNRSKSYTSEKRSPVNFKVTNPSSKYVQRHKHHHVHEYIHHHYHHF